MYPGTYVCTLVVGFQGNPNKFTSFNYENQSVHRVMFGFYIILGLPATLEI